MSKELQDKTEKILEEILRKRNQSKEELLLAFISKYGCDPAQAVLVETQTDTGYTWHIQRSLPCCDCGGYERT